MTRKVSSEYKKLQPYVVEDARSVANAVLGGASGGGGSGGVTDHGALTGLADDDHPQYLTPVRGDARYIPSTRILTAGAGLTGGGDLSADRTFAVGAGLGITVNADDVALTTPGTLHIASGNGSSGNHTHAVTTSSNPGAAAAILSSSAAGLLTLYNGAYTQAAQSEAVFASGFAGSGWRVDYGITAASKASAEFDDLTVRGRMRVYELLIQQIRATNGSVFVSSASKAVAVAVDINPLWTFNGSQATLNGSNATLTMAYYTIDTAVDKDNEGGTDRDLYHGFLFGDIIRAQQVRWNGSAFAGIIRSDLEVTAITSLTQYQAVLVSGDAPAVGYDFVRLGNSTDTTRRGSVYLTADDSNAPFIDIVDNVAAHTDWNTPGKIKVRVGKLTGISDTDFGGSLSGYGLYGNNVYLKGNIYATSGVFNGTVYASAGVFQGTISAASGTVGGWAIGASALTAGSGATTVGIDSGGTNPAFYAGSATPGSAPFMVTAAGALTASSATITGSILASSGGISGNFYVGSDVGAAGNLYVGSNADIRMSGDGIRLVLPNLAAPALNTSIPTNSSALRWFSNIGATWTGAANYTGQISYRDTSNKVVDWVAMSYVGSTDYATYYARSMLYANRYNGSTHKECRIEATVDPNAGGAYVTAVCDTFYTSNNAYITGEMSAQVIVDRTPHFDGDALAELRGVKGNKQGGIDHGSLPTFARKTFRRKTDDPTQDEEGRDLGAMISILTVAVQQLDARLDALERRNNGN